MLGNGSRLTPSLTPVTVFISRIDSLLPALFNYTIKFLPRELRLFSSYYATNYLTNRYKQKCMGETIVHKKFSVDYNLYNLLISIRLDSTPFVKVRDQEVTNASISNKIDVQSPRYYCNLFAFTFSLRKYSLLFLGTQVFETRKSFYVSYFENLFIIICSLSFDQTDWTPCNINTKSQITKSWQ